MRKPIGGQEEKLPQFQGKSNNWSAAPVDLAGSVVFAPLEFDRGRQGELPQPLLLGGRAAFRAAIEGVNRLVTWRLETVRLLFFRGGPDILMSGRGGSRLGLGA